MAVRFSRPVSRSAHIGRALGLFALMVFLFATLMHRFGPLTTPDFVALVLVSAAFAAVAVLFAVIGLARLWQVGAEGGVASFKALLYSALPLAMVATGAFFYFTRPAIHDVSTDLVDAPSWISPPAANQQWLRRGQEITPQDREAQYIAYPGLTGRRYEGALDRVYEAARTAARGNGITILDNRGAVNAMPELEDRPLVDGAEDDAVADAPPDNIPVPLDRPSPDVVQPVAVFGRNGDVLLQGETRGLILGLRFDVMIRLREEAETTLVDIRVASRYGEHDFGMSADIAEHYLRALDAELLGIAGG